MKYQKIHIGPVNVNGIDRMPDYKQIFKNKPKGKRILDIGCNMGFYALQAASEGALVVTGIDTSTKALEHAINAKRLLNYDHVHFIKGDIFNTNFDEYDIVLCLNFVHHITPIVKLKLLLDKIDCLARESMYFTITPFKESLGTNYKEEVNNKGLLKMRLKPQFFEQYWPAYDIECEDSKTFQGRIMIKINK
jgi:SAM-dependent methyltransferase